MRIRYLSIFDGELFGKEREPLNSLTPLECIRWRMRTEYPTSGLSPSVARFYLKPWRPYLVVQTLNMVGDSLQKVPPWKESLFKTGKIRYFRGKKYGWGQSYHKAKAKAFLAAYGNRKWKGNSSREPSRWVSLPVLLHSSYKSLTCDWTQCTTPGLSHTMSPGLCINR